MTKPFAWINRLGRLSKTVRLQAVHEPPPPRTGYDIGVATADALRDACNWPQAAEAYRNLASAYGGTPALHVQHGHALKEAGQPHEALRAYAHAIELAPNDTDARLHHAHLLKRMGQPEAIAAFERLLALADDDDTRDELDRLCRFYGPAERLRTNKLGATKADRSSMAVPLSTPPGRFADPGLYGRRGAVRFIAESELGTSIPRLRLTIDGSMAWEGEVTRRHSGGGERIDSVMSVPEPDRPTGRRTVVVEALSHGIHPPRAEIALPYSERFDGWFEMASAEPGEVERRGHAEFIDSDGLTVTPFLRALGADGSEVALSLSAWKRQGDGFSIEFSVPVDTPFQIYPMWSVCTLDERKQITDLQDAFTVLNSGPVGRLERVGKGHADGWAFWPGRLNCTMIVDILVQGRVIGCGLADRPHPGVAEVLGGTEPHGFSIPLPPGLSEGVSVEARARGAAEAFAQAPFSSSAAGDLFLSAPTPATRTVPPAAPARSPSTVALLLTTGNWIWREETLRELRLAGIGTHEIDRRENAFAERFDALLRQIEFERVLVLGEGVVWSNDVLPALETALDSSNAALAVPILVSPRPQDVPGTPDRWGWGLDLTGEAPSFVTLAPTPRLFNTLDRAPFVPVAGGDWMSAGLFDRRRLMRLGRLADIPSAADNPERIETSLVLRIIEAGEGVALASGRGLALHKALDLEPRVPDPKGLLRRLSAKPLDRSALTARPLVVALILSRTSAGALEGDVMVGRDLAAAIHAELLDAEIRLVAREDEAGADLWGVDIAICLRDDCDPRRFRGRSSACHVVFWIRNCFDAFMASGYWRSADDVWMSSEREASRFEERTSRPARLLRLATNLDRFGSVEGDRAFACDVCFTGSYWGIHREIAICLAPETLDAVVRVFGAGWDRVPELAAFSEGAVPYERLAGIYARSRIVVDDANHVTVDSGSVNSRVFDAIAAGALPITNGLAGAQEVFGTLLPTYDTAQGLTNEIRHWLSNEGERAARVAELRIQVARYHTFQRRASDAVNFLSKEL